MENQSIKVARALVSGIYDIENDMMITAKITRYDTGEREIAVELIEKMKQIGLKKELILFDRGYPSKNLILYLENNGIKYLMRDSGVMETLITNIFDESFGINEFKELYFKRWGIETKYDELKNRLQIENFTGDTPIAVEQDFYASIYLSNVLMLLEDNHKKRSKMLYAVMQKIIQNSIPIRPGRNNIRKMGVKSNKYPLNQKSCL